MSTTKTYLKLFVILCCLFCSIDMLAVSDEELMRLEAKMNEHFISKDIDSFNKSANRLKEASKKAGNERMYYRAWGNQAIFEATHQDYKEAFAIVKQIRAAAQTNGSTFGEYMALHAEATILLQKQDYDLAEQAFLKAVEFHHRHFTNESAGEDLQELMKIANHRKDGPAGVKYARLILAEPNVAPIHKGRALYRLSQMAFNKNDVEEFNRIYDEMMALKKTDGIGTLVPVVEVNHHIMNGEYEQALILSDKLDPEMAAERKAVIYHRMGNDTKAYEYMQKYKKISDSIILVSHGNVVASCFVQMNNDRLMLEQHLLEKQNNELRNRIYLIIGISCIVILLVIIYKRQKRIKQLNRRHKKLVYEKDDAERALVELEELSFFESKTALALTTPLQINELCDRLTTTTQKICHKGVATIFQTSLPDDYKITTDADALEKLLTHLLNYSVRYTQKGFIRLNCADSGEFIRFSVADTSAGLNKQKNQLVGMFSQHGNKIRFVGMNFNICQSITRLLHGRIWHDMDYDKGTRFCFEIPKVND